MMSHDDPRWASLLGGYRLPFDPRPALLRLQTDGNDAKAWAELWANLHHQGDVDDASYASVVELAGIHESTRLSTANLFALVAAVEIERHRRTNPPVPEWLKAGYRDAWLALRRAALGELEESTSPDVLQFAAAVVLLSKGLDQLGALVWYQDASTLQEYLDDHLAWTELYSPKTG
jgi:hypothetical protein